MTAAAMMFVLSGCDKHNEDDPSNEPENSAGTFKLTEIVDAAAAAYQAWEEKESFAETIKVGSKDLNTPEYQFAICQALVNISAGKKDDITVLSYKPAEHPDKDSYDRETIAVVNGPKNGEETEDLVNIATRMLARMQGDLRVPNQTNFTRNGTAIAFSTERATTVISRELANYKANGSLDAEVSAAYKGAGSSIKAFAKEYVKILDVWQQNVGDLNRLSNWELAQEGDADVVKDAHYVPNDYTFVFAEKTYTTADMLETALRSYLLLRGYDGKDIDAIGFGSFPTTAPVNMNAIVPETHEYGWNMPLIETSNGGYLYKVVDGMEVYGQVDVAILDNWAMRSLNFSFNNDMRWTNFCGYPRDPITNYKGCFSSGRALLTYAFFFKYLLDNNIDKDIDKIDASVVIRSELFGIDTANNDKDIQLKTTALEFDCGEGAKEANFQSKAAWTATPSADWITVEPASGEAGAITISVKVAENKGEAREGAVIIKGGNVTEGLEIAVKQAEYTAANPATIKEFAQEYVKLLDIWKNTTGSIDQMKGENYEGGSNIVENAHYIPMATTVTLGNKTYTTADMLELALRSYLLVRGYDGLDDNKAHIGAGTIPALADGAKTMSETIVPVTHAYQWGSLPYNETGTYNVSTGQSSGNGGHLFKVVDGKEIHCEVDPLLLDNWAMRALNWPLDPNKGDGQISNLCGYPRDPFNNYYGAFSSMRALITYAFFFKYMLDNNLDKADGLGADVVIRSELFGDEGYVEPAKATIKDFATEFVKILDVWQANVGDVKMHSSVDATPNAHYIPEGTTIKVGEKTYNTADMFETAARSYLLLRGYDGLNTEKYGNKSIPALADGAKKMSETDVPETHGYSWGDAPSNETGSYDIATGQGSGNNGHLIKIVDGKAVHSQVDVTILDNQVMRALNYAHGKNISNMCTYPRADHGITNYAGSFSSMRALITYAFFFKYMLDNNLEKADEIGADVAIRSELFGDEGSAEPAKATIKDFATEFVKILDVWQANVGDVKMHSSVDATPNAHYIPEGTTIKVGEKTYNTADMFETAARSYLLLRGYDGLNTEKYGNKSIPALADGAKKMSETDVPETHGYSWGDAPSNETGSYDIATGQGSGNNGHLIKIVDGKAVHSQVDVTILDNQVMRALNYAHGKNISNMCTYPRADHGITNYAGSFSSMRALITYAFFFKYMLDNKLEKADEITADVVIRSELFGDENPFASNVAYKKGSSCYDDGLATVNGYAFTPTLKLGTSSKFGDVTVTLPAGTKAVKFYAVGWKDQPASLKATAGSNAFTFELKANDGATGNAPYTITVTDENKYTLDLGAALPADVDVKVETYEGANKNKRAIIFGVQPVK